MADRIRTPRHYFWPAAAASVLRRHPCGGHHLLCAWLYWPSCRVGRVKEGATAARGVLMHRRGRPVLASPSAHGGAPDPDAPGRVPAAHASRSRRMCFWTFPDGMSGKLSTKTQWRGTLKCARCRRQSSTSSASAGGSPATGRTTAATSSPQNRSSTPTTATSGDRFPRPDRGGATSLTGPINNRLTEGEEWRRGVGRRGGEAATC